MTDLQFPRRRMDDNGNWVIESPPSDPVADRQHAVDYWQRILNDTWPDGTPAYTAEARELAARELKLMGAGHG